MDSAAVPALAAALLSRLGPVRGHETLAEALADPLLLAFVWRALRDEMALECHLLDAGIALALTSPLPLHGAPPDGNGVTLSHARQGDPLAPLLPFLTGQAHG